jgi:hypothetical protein
MTSAVPPIDQSLLPAAIRTGDAKAKKAYETALGFEQVLVQQLSQELGQSAGGFGTGSTDGAGVTGSGGDDGSDATGIGSGDPAAGAYGQLLPDALSSSLMSSGGLGLALGLAQAIDPAIGSRVGK